MAPGRLKGLLILMDPSSIPSYSFHGTHMDITTNSSASTLKSAFEIRHLSRDGKSSEQFVRRNLAYR
jgi:hypothetical protein